MHLKTSLGGKCQTHILLVFGMAVVFLLQTPAYIVDAQSRAIDSLRIKLEASSGNDKIDVLNALMAEFSCKKDSLALAYFQATKEILKSRQYPFGELTSLKQYGSMKYCQGDLDSTIYYYRKAVDIGVQHQLKQEAARLFSNLGYFFQTSGSFDSSAYYFQKGLAVAYDADDSVSIGSIHVGLGTLFQHKGHVDTALETYFHALKIAEKIDNKELIVTTKLNIGTIYYDHYPNKLRISDFTDMLEITREIGDKKREVSVLEWLGYLEADSGKYDLSLKYFNEGIAVNQTLKDQNSEILLLQGISYALNLAGDNKKSIQYNDQIIDLALSSGYEIYLPSLYANNVVNYLALKQYDNAINDGLKAIETGEKSEQVDLYYKVYKDMAKAYYHLGQHNKAYEAQLEYTQLSNEIFDAEKSRQLAEMETKYDTEKKETEIVSLSQQAAIQALEIRQKNQAMIIGAIVVFFAGMVLWLMYQQRTTRRKNAQTELEQRFLRSQLNPHFISNALVAVQQFMLKKQPEVAATYLAKFSKLMREILENSRHEFIPVEDEVNMLRNYLDIHKLRLNDSFDYRLTLDASIDAETDTIPPMFVQPFVENAIEHGISHSKDKGQIDILLTKEGEYIAIEIRDNGGGLTLSKTGEKRSLSSTIIKERMELFNLSLKKKIEFILDEITNEEGKVMGTRVELKVPFSYV